MKIPKGWKMLEQGPLFILKYCGEYVIEEPYPDTAESVVRVFVDWKDIQEYHKIAAEYHLNHGGENSDLVIETVSLVDLFSSLELIQCQSVDDFGCPAALALSEVDGDSFVLIDVLYSSYSSTPETYN